MAEPFTTYKLIVLYMAKHAKETLTNSQISEFILDREYTDYFQLQKVLSELTETELLRKRTISNSSYYELTEENEKIINKAVKEGRRVIAVGTTSGRVLETVSDENGFVHAGHGETQIFIYPGYKFKILKGMITNFHLPESTLLMYVCAFAGYENVMNMYKTAVDMKYRFFSFGDATLLI